MPSRASARVAKRKADESEQARVKKAKKTPKKVDEAEAESDTDNTPVRRRSTRVKSTVQASPVDAASQSSASTPTPDSPAQQTPVAKRSSTKKKASKSRKAQSTASAANPQGIDAVFLSGKKLKTFANKWCESYDEDRPKALAKLLNIIMASSGCEGTIGEDDLDNVQDTCEKLSDQFPVNTSEYPLRQADAKHKNFKRQLAAFVRSIVEAGANEIIFDDVMSEGVVTWLTTLASSHIRAFRHTSTFVASHFGAALIDVREQLEEQLSTMQAELKAERKKKRSSSQAKSLEEEVTKNEERIQFIDELLDKIFDGITMHRYRDISKDIREDVLDTLATWIEGCKSKFLKDEYMKYLGWCLNDKEANVRRVVVKALTRLYSDKDNTDALTNFTQRFKGRMLRMCEDKDDGVVEECLGLMLELHRCQLLDDETESPWLWDLVYSTQKHVASAAGALVASTLVEDQLMSILEEDKITDEALKRRITVRTMLKFISHTGKDVGMARIPYFVEAIWNHLDCFQDWEAMTDLLLQDENFDSEEEQETEDTRLRSEEETLLLQLLLFCIQKAQGELVLPHHRKTNFGANQKRQFEASKEEVSEHLIPLLGNLFDKFGAEEDKMEVLVCLPQFLKLDVFVESRNIKAFDGLLQGLRDAFTRLNSQRVLEGCVETFQFLCDCELALQGRAEASVVSMIDELRRTLDKTIEQGIGEEMQASEDRSDEHFEMNKSFRLLSLLSRSHHVVNDAVLRHCKTVLDCVQEESINDSLVKSAIQLYCSHLIWALEKLSQDFDTNEATKLRQQRDEFVTCLDTLLESGTAAVQEAAFLSYIELIVAFSDTSDISITLEWGPTPQAQFRLSDYVVSTVLAADPVEPSEEDFGDDEEARVKEQLRCKEEEDRRLHVLVEFCRLVSFNLIDGVHLGPCLQHYLKNDTYSEVLKFCLAKIREHDPDAVVRVIIDAFKNWTDQAGETAAMQEVAHRLALTFGVNTAKYRRQIADIHSSLIVFALEEDAPKTRLRAFNVVKEFSMKLDKEARQSVLAFLEDKVTKASNQPDDTATWQPYRNLVRVLSDRKTGRTPASKQKKRGRRSSISSVASLGGSESKSTGFQWGQLPKRKRAAEDVEDDGSDGDDDNWLSARNDSRRTKRQLRTDLRKELEQVDGDDAAEDSEDSDAKQPVRDEDIEMDDEEEEDSGPPTPVVVPARKPRVRRQMFTVEEENDDAEEDNSDLEETGL